MWKEQHLYGSSRLGMWQPEKVLSGVVLPMLGVCGDGQGVRLYELTNHLGNVLATINDKGKVVSAQDYFPFGLKLDGRMFNTEGYRFGFNGKEYEGTFKSQDYGKRIYRADLGKFLSVDPLMPSYPWYTPYQFAGNMPIAFIDLDGQEEVSPTIHYNPMTQSGNASYPVLRKSQWYVTDRECACNSFASAASYNTTNLNDAVYQPVQQIHKYYVWAAQEIDKTKANIKFYHAARDVTSLLGVGGAYIAPEFISGLSDEGRQSLADVNTRLLKENMPVVREILATGKSSLFPGKQGIVWDFNYVNREQTFLTDVVTKKPLGQSDKDAINQNFSTFEFLHLEYKLAKTLVNVKKLDYEPQRQRMAIGRSLVFMLHMEREGFEGSSEYKKGIEFLETEYGKENVQNFLNLFNQSKKTPQGLKD